MRESFASARDGTRLWVRAGGAADAGPATALFSDGLVCDGFIWKYLWDDLGAVLPVAHWNYRGHGRSGAPRDVSRVTVPHLAEDLDVVREHLGDPPVVLVGHSLGVQVCLEAYRLRRERVLGLVLLAGSFGRVTHTFKGSDLLASVLPPLIAWTQAHPRLARALWGSVPVGAALRIAELTGDVDPRLVDVADIAPYFEHVTRMDVDLFLRMLQSAGDHSAEDLLPEVRVPALVVAGDRDSFTPPALSEAMVELMPRAELLMIAGGTHVAPLEHRELVGERVRDFVRRLLEDARAAELH